MSYVKSYPPKPGSGRTAPIVDQAMIIDIQVLINKTEPEGSSSIPLDLSGQLDNATVERLWLRYGDTRNLGEADLNDPGNARLAAIPKELRAAIINYQQAAPTREARELRSERFSLPTAFRDAAAKGVDTTNKGRRAAENTSQNHKQSFMKVPLFAQLSQLDSLMHDPAPSEAVVSAETIQ